MTPHSFCSVTQHLCSFESRIILMWNMSPSSTQCSTGNSVLHIIPHMTQVGHRKSESNKSCKRGRTSCVSGCMYDFHLCALCLCHSVTCIWPLAVYTSLDFLLLSNLSVSFQWNSGHVFVTGLWCKFLSVERLMIWYLDLSCLSKCLYFKRLVVMYLLQASDVSSCLSRD